MTQDELILRVLKRILQRQADMIAAVLGVNSSNDDLIDHIDRMLEAYTEADHG